MAKKQSKREAHEYWSYPDMTKALEIALYYGFTPVDPVAIEKSDRDFGKHFATEEGCYYKPEEKAALLRTWFGDNQSMTPVMIATAHTSSRSSKAIEYTLDVLGTNRSIADATLLKTTYETIRSEGYENLNLEINSIGDRESFARYTRELGNYYRKHVQEVCAESRQLMKKGGHHVPKCEHQECKDIFRRAPHPINFLSEPSRSYFMELLELLETTDIPYSLNNELVANPECTMHTVFRITSNDGKKDEVVAYGARWGMIAKKMGFKKDIQGMSATILIQRPEKKDKPAKIKKPQLYFIQMGQEAKLKSLRVIEVLRQSKIPVYHSLTKDKLTAQLMSAENLKVPYILIMGQKESMENTIVIREMSNRSQETVRVEQVAEYIKRIIR
ncbi:MAG: histidyl-tRNA synthetase, histidyl-tRNA synthetase [Candidatus Paceibacter sp.]|jgi:histidyl-tRNA synthetase|nr:histidyl-tRNA synthetase, histidyl-tRNA synthetase [Candidatus Paceibacter sp.]